MRTIADIDRKSHIELYNGQPASVANFVTFGSACTVNQNPKSNSLMKRGTPGRIFGKNEVLRDNLLSIFKTVSTTRHVGQVHTLSHDTNLQLRRVHVKRDNSYLLKLSRLRWAELEE